MPVHPTPPFNAPAARRLREALGMAPGHVAYGLRAQYGLNVGPDLVVAWERGARAPDSREITALAGVLWCSPGELFGAPTTLREHRMSRGLAAQDLARRLGMVLGAYQRMEDEGRWRGNERQTAALAEALALGPREFMTVTGRDDELAELLRSAVMTRWQAYVRPTTKLLPLPRQRIEDVLQQLHTDYQSRMVSTLSWGGGDSGDGAAGREYLDVILGHFWQLARN
ncbi:helix-turn-helix transcriptional regulator [Streptomyces sp. H27-C3]|uniref:helix-turn-helix domain-containing protein n=1 Tax=Streptomyces sp. H27-C3 TaxID=3046305 RepID=UPI0024B9CAC9|nr:helix-turn-helix transcriptional regulator [Streptomyces sp. H27-C3]MDJ0460724.1 helix-turn-helix transcriptional regulator [Streptomyces sp. H27-C3]